MMKNLKLIPIIFVLTLNTFAQNMCHFIYRPNTAKIYSQDFSKINRINRLDKFSAKFRKYISKQDEHIPSLISKYYDDFAHLEQELIKGDYFKTMNRYQMLFRKTEGYAIMVKDHVALADALRGFVMKSHGDDVVGYFVKKGVRENLAIEYAKKIRTQSDAISSLKKVERFVRRKFRKFGRRFDEYSTVNLSLKRLKNSKDCSEDCKAAIDGLYESIGFGAKSERAMYSSILDGRKGITFSEMEKLFYSHPDSLLISARKKFYYEVGAFLRAKIKKINFLNELWEFFKIKGGGTRRSSLFMRLFKGHYDRIARNIHRPVYNKISYSDLGIPEKYELMFDRIKQLDQELFWMDFSRETESQVRTTWNKLKEHAKKFDSIHYPLMMRAEELGSRLGPIGERDFRNLKRIVGAMIVGGSAYAYFTFGKDEDPSGEVKPIANNNNQVTQVDPDNNGQQISNPSIIPDEPILSIDPFEDDEEDANIIDIGQGHVLIEYDSDEDLEAQEILMDATIDLQNIEREMQEIMNQRPKE